MSQVLFCFLDDQNDQADAKLPGLYSHAGQSYAASSQQLTLSVGAPPTATSTQTLLRLGDGSHALRKRQVKVFNQCKQSGEAKHDLLERHAGVYPFLDMQQLATQASPSASEQHRGRKSSTSGIVFTILAEFASVYRERETCEALVAAGSFAPGHGPCKSYPGWSVVKTWRMTEPPRGRRSGWQVGRISHKHSILTRDPIVRSDITKLYVGQEVRVFPNHTCVAGVALKLVSC
ncbi:MAG: hypothetical protein Q9200_000215 [Gallowayella weberi]